jgi:mevalonate kinase
MNVKITISSQIPIRAGLGSSAALSAALAGALYYYAHGRLDLDLIQHFAHNAERVFHSNPSGLDSFSSIFGTSTRIIPF